VNTPPVRPVRRKAPRDVRHQQLIEATIDVLVAKGFATLTVADVARAAGLSVGVVIFHFGAKEKLLKSTLEFLAEDYYGRLQAAMARAEATPAAQLSAILLADFDPDHFTLRALQAWIAFWGETQARPIYDEICAARDDQRLATITGLCKAVIAGGRYPIDLGLCVATLDALSEGLWLKAVNGAARVPIGEAINTSRQVIQASLAQLFPNHFPTGQ
jgi:TetR/AcrR family transcriptional regulator, transcriptional repressor of bet genes